MINVIGVQIKGKKATALCFTNVIEEDAIAQIREMCDQDFAEGCKVRIMPDVHVGIGCTIGTTMTVKDKVVPNLVGVDIGCGMYTVKLPNQTLGIMPDVHVGIGCTIGTTMTVKDKVVPNLVGVDIGCGMYTVKLPNQTLDFEKVDEVCHAIPSGRDIWESRQEKFDLTKLCCYRHLKQTKRIEKSLGFEKVDEVCHAIPSGRDIWESRQEKFDLTKLCCYRHLKQTKRIEKSLGSLGGGNHFIEIDKAADGSLYLIVHTGSRNLGKQVAEFYQQLAIDLHKGKETYFEKKEALIKEYNSLYLIVHTGSRNLGKQVAEFYQQLAIDLHKGKETYFEKKEALIKEYKVSGRRNEIQEALKGLQWNPKPITMPMELCFLYGKYMEAYLHDIDICQSKTNYNADGIVFFIWQIYGSLFT